MGGKSLRRAIRGIPIVAVLTLVFASIASTATAASTYFGQTPGVNAVVSLTTPLMSVRVSDPAGINTGYQMKVDGLSRTPKVTWAPDRSYCQLSYQQTAALANGTHTIYASVYTGAGRTSTTWPFTVKVPPVVGLLTPADGSVVNSQAPVISATVTPNGGSIASYSMAVDGVTVNATYSAASKVLSYTPVTQLANDRVHTVTVSATDSAGNTTTVSWSFEIQIYADMDDTAGCTDCHPDYPSIHPMGNCAGCHDSLAPFPAYWNMDNPQQYAHGAAGHLDDVDCSYCHSDAFAAVPRHEYSIQRTHVSGSDMSGCACHVRSLTIEHNRWLKPDGTKVACIDCHGQGATDRVKAAVLSGSLACLDCHENAQHESLHKVSIDASCVGCHQGDSLTSIHLSGESLTCGTCHSSTNPVVQGAITAHDKACSACHGAQHALDKSFCYGCHQASLLTYNGQAVADQSKHMTVTSSTNAATSWPGSGLPAAACANCHDNHEGGTRAAGNQLCYTCHDAAGTVKPASYSYQGQAAYQAGAHAAVASTSRKDVVLSSNSAGFSAWESVAEPTPSSPGTPLSAEKVAALSANDGSRAITSLSAINGGYDYQMYRFKLPVDASSVDSVNLQWAGFGEETPNYPVSLCIWDRSLAGGAGGWQTLQTSQLANRTFLQFPVSATANADASGYIYVMAKAKNVIDSTLTSGPNLTTVVSGASKSLRADWTTLGLTNTWGEAGATSSYGRSYGTDNRTTSHSVIMTGTVGATYHYRLRSTGRDGDVWTTGDTLINWATPTATPVPDVSSDYPVAVSFAWTAPEGATPNTVYRVHLWSPYSGFSTYGAWSNQLSYLMPSVPLDYYYWSVESKDLLTGASYLPSVVDEFYIVQASGSCPFLYTWDGEKYAFEADTIVAGRMGQRSPSGYSRPTPADAYVLKTTPAEKDGKLSFKLVEERYETDYIDKYTLKAVDVPSGAKIFSEKPVIGITSPGFPTTLHTVRDAKAPLSAVRTNTGDDVTEKLSRVDGDKVLLNEDRNAGLEYQTIELDLGDVAAAPQTKIVMNAVSVFPNTSAGQSLIATFGPRTKIAVQESDGTWTNIPSSVALLATPPEFDRPYVFDLTNAVRGRTGKVRFTFLYKTFIDAIRVDTSVDETLKITDVALDSAVLGRHGVNRMTSEGDVSRYVYGEPEAQGVFFPGNYTKYSNVKSLLTSVDDKFVICGQGDELSLSFAPPAAPEPGYERYYVVDANGYYKDAKLDLDKTVEPLPFSAMSTYPYASGEQYPNDAEHQNYLAMWNTRYENGAVMPSDGAGQAGAEDVHRSLNVDFVSMEVGYQGGTYAGGGCELCHNVHGQMEAQTGLASNGAIWKSEDRLCTGDGSGCHSSASSSARGVNIAAAFSATDTRKHHDVSTKDQLANGSKVACSGCHNPHTNAADKPVADPDNIGTALSGKWLDRYVNDAGESYLLIGAAHDAVAPVVSAQVFNINNTGYLSPTVSWTTNEPGTSWVDVGLTTAYELGSYGDNTLATAHTVTFAGLTPGGTYHYRVRTADALGNVKLGPDALYTAVTPPDVPTLTPAPDTTVEYGPVSYSLTWTPSASPDGHSTQYYAEMILPSGATRTTGWTTSTSWLFTEGYNGLHRWRVKARDSVHTGAESTWSAYSTFTVTETNPPSASCPFLFTNDGTTYNFEADTVVGGKLAVKSSIGYLKATPGDSYVVRQPAASVDGSYQFRLVEERYETDYLDKLKLYSVDIPEGTQLFAEKPVQSRPFAGVPTALHTVRDLRAPVSAKHVETGEDVLSKLSADDKDYVVLNNDRNVDFSYQTLEVDLGDVSSAPKVKVVFDASTAFPTTGAGVAREGTFGLRQKMQVQQLDGTWVDVPNASMPQIVPPEFRRQFLVDMTSVTRNTTGKVRFIFLNKTYIDSIKVDTSADEPVVVDELSMTRGELFKHGVDAKTEGEDLYQYIYGETSKAGRFFPGNYTKYGDVSPLMSTVDDMFVVYGQGDALALEFAAPEQGPAAGMIRNLVFDFDGWYKDAKVDVPHTVTPMPFHAMSGFPYPDTERYPDDDAHQAYLAEWNTRYEGATVVSEAAVGQSLLDRFVAFVRDTVDSVSADLQALLSPKPVLVATAPTHLHYSVNTDVAAIRTMTGSGALATSTPSAAWASTGATPTPSAPGAAADAAALAAMAAKDEAYFITDLATADRAINWQLAKFDVGDSRNLRQAFITWNGHGEPSAGYNTQVLVWDFKGAKWESISSIAAGTDQTVKTVRDPEDNAFCLTCHDGTTPTNTTMPSTVKNVGASWTASGADAHGDRAGSQAKFLAPEFGRGQRAMGCETCHDTHGNNNLYHLQSSINGKTGISVQSSNQTVSACSACHTGTFDAWHQQCVDCHSNPDHSGAGPFDANRDCLACHKHGTTFTHPASCHCGPWPSTFNTF